jgi:hypothetical protein
MADPGTAGGGGTSGNGGKSEEKWPFWREIGALLFGALLIVTMVVLLIFLDAQTSVSTGVKLPVLLLVGTATLMLVLGALVVVYKRLKLANKDEALGLPTGSIRAVLALELILLFFISGIFFATSLNTGNGTRELHDVTATQLLQFPQEQIKCQRIETPGAAPASNACSANPVTSPSTSTSSSSTSTTVPSGTATTVSPPTTTPTVEPLYDVVLFVPADTESKDLAKQIVTAGATLVAAVAAFYFGASTVAQAHKNATVNAASQADTITKASTTMSTPGTTGPAAEAPTATSGSLDEPYGPMPADDLSASDNARPAPDQEPTIPGGDQP